MIRTVLVGLGPLPGAADAALLGHRLAAAAGASLHLVAPVLDPFADVLAARLGLDVDHLHERLLEKRRSEFVEALGNTRLPAATIEALTVRLGRPEHLLAHEVKRLDADLVVLSGVGRSGSGQLEVARHLIQSIRRPVVFTGSEGQGVDRVLAAVDLSAAAEPTLRFAEMAARLLGVGVEVAHVCAPAEVSPEWTGTPGVAEALLEAETSAATAFLDRLLPGGTSWRTLHGPVVATLRELARTTPGLLLVVGAQGRGWVHRRLIGSTTDALLAECVAALAVVPLDPRVDAP